MKIVLQRVLQAKVEVAGETVGEIGKGYLLLLGVSNEDNKDIADKMIEKISRLRIFEDENGKTNLSIDQVDGEVLVVSQFTLYADCRKGNRPSFTNAGSPDKANELYEYIVERCKGLFKKTQHGVFGADMQVSLINDGPFTLVLDSEEILQNGRN
ncbi:MAG: D-tyrosyl-tRNA(Tyr) deacylase [Clostridia bacterium]|nr:D-tyrosyl-tRNA(Tyr) deacylase [Clostridia bacterium]